MSLAIAENTDTVPIMRTRLTRSLLGGDAPHQYHLTRETRTRIARWAEEQAIRHGAVLRALILDGLSAVEKGEADPDAVAPRVAGAPITTVRIPEDVRSRIGTVAAGCGLGLRMMMSVAIQIGADRRQRGIRPSRKRSVASERIVAALRHQLAERDLALQQALRRIARLEGQRV